MQILLEKLRTHRQLVFNLMDAFLLAVSFCLVAFFHSSYSPSGYRFYGLTYGICLVIVLLLLRLFRTNRNLWRYAGPREYLTLMHAYLAAFVLFFVLNKTILRLPVSELMVLLANMVALFASLYIRISYRAVYARLQRKTDKAKNSKRPLAIIGAGAAGIALQEEISRNPKSPYTVWGFFDDDTNKVGMAIHGVPVRGRIDDLPERMNRAGIQDVVLAIPSLGLKRRQEVLELCNRFSCRLKIMPDTIVSLVDQKASMERSMRPIKIEDLLGRTSVHFDRAELDPFIKGKTVLVSGGGGSIGSEIARQLVQLGVKNLIIFDINENDSYVLFRELKPSLPADCHVVIEIGSMVDKKRVLDIFRRYRPDIVFHAAAHKHVPLMEGCPYEAVYNNIFGTYHLVQAAKAFHCEKFVLISTDKAVNPTNIMGATKRYCENLLRAISLEKDNQTSFVSVRFGNVLGSHGSVIPLFQMQIAQGGPVTVTDKRMTRYFMTIPEAAGLVIRAGAMAKNSETYILDMGSPVKILDLAENLVRLSGFEPYKEIDIVETGLRPGEKLYEELLVNDKNHVATSDSKIFIERNSVNVTMDLIHTQLQALKEAVDATDSQRVLQLMRSYVPNFKTPEEVNGAVAAGLLA